MTITNSIISGNHAVNYGGGIGNYSSSGGAILTMANCTISGNMADQGGGISSRNSYFEDNALTITNSTISGNVAIGDTGIGGGIYGGGYGDLEVRLDNTIVAGNMASSVGQDINIPQYTLYGSYNLIGDGTGQTFVDGINGNQVGAAESPIDAMFVRNPSDGDDGWGR